MTLGVVVELTLQVVAAVVVGWVVGEWALDRFILRSWPQAKDDFGLPERALIAFLGLCVFAVVAMVLNLVSGGAVFGVPGIVTVAGLIAAPGGGVPACLAERGALVARRIVRTRTAGVLHAAGPGRRFGGSPRRPPVASGVDRAAPSRAADPYRSGSRRVREERLSVGLPCPPRDPRSADPRVLDAGCSDRVARSDPAGPPAGGCLHRTEAQTRRGVVRCLGRQPHRRMGMGIRPRRRVRRIPVTSAPRRRSRGRVTECGLRALPSRAPARAGPYNAGDRRVVRGLAASAAQDLDQRNWWHHAGFRFAVAAGIAGGITGLISVPLFVTVVVWLVAAALVAPRGFKLPFLVGSIGVAVLVFALWAGPVAADYFHLGGFVNVTPHVGTEWPLGQGLLSWGLLAPAAAAGR